MVFPIMKGLIIAFDPLLRYIVDRMISVDMHSAEIEVCNFILSHFYPQLQVNP